MGLFCQHHTWTRARTKAPVSKMCFSPEMSGMFSIIGVLVSLWVFKFTGNTTVAKGIFYFVLMEALQYVQYMYIATDVDPAHPTLAELQKSPQCQMVENQVLTWLGFLHICYQPFFTHYMSCGFAHTEKSKAQFSLVKKLCFCGGSWLLFRSVLAIFPSTYDNIGLGWLLGDAQYYANGGADGHIPREWLSGGVLCTYQGIKHLAWSVPMIAPSYYVPAGSIHSFLMFMPFFLVDHESFVLNAFNWMCGLSIFFIGPVLGDWITSNKHEAASIWCFFSIVQCTSFVVMTFLNPWFMKQIEADKKIKAAKSKTN